MPTLADLVTFKAVLAAGVLAALWTWETWWPFVASRRQRLRHGARNLGLAAVNVAIVGPLFAGATAGVATWAGQNGYGLLADVRPGWLQVALALVLLDFWMYVWHRLNHAIPLLWRFHRTHHSDTELDSTTGVRFHLGEQVFSAVLRLVVVVALGLRLEWILLYELVFLPVVLLHHGNVALPERWDRVLRWLIVTPGHHRVHHCDTQPDTDSNFASVLSLWDRLFGTYRQRAATARPRFGLPEFADPAWQTWRGLWLTPLARSEQRPTDTPGSRHLPREATTLAHHV
jgi:sterol desaturase/sphingolipid hydroxylase (fatty acid hydroxylase superfamily)